LGFSFLCPVAETVILSITHPYISVLEQQGNRATPILREMKKEINEPLAAILTLNTTAHTIDHVDVEYPFQALCPDYGLVALSGVLSSFSCRARPLPRFAGVTSTRCLLLGENTP
jgi:hypothetical protein